MNNAQRFCKEERLKSKKAISALFDKGKYINSFPLKLVWQLSDNEYDYPVKVAFTVSKKSFKRAVDRNYIKRKMREAYRRQKCELYEFLNEKNIHLHIFFIYQDQKDIAYQDIYNHVEKLLKILRDKL